MTDVTGARRAVAYRRQLADYGFKRFEHLLEGRRLVPANVDRTDFGPGLLDGLHQQVDQVFDVDEIPGLLTIAEHGDRKPFSARSLKMLITPEYGEDGSWRGPKMLKKRKITGSSPC